MQSYPIVRIINSVTGELELSKSLRRLVEGEEHFEIKGILDSRYYKGKLQYLSVALWKGYALADAKC